MTKALHLGLSRVAKPKNKASDLGLGTHRLCPVMPKDLLFDPYVADCDAKSRAFVIGSAEGRGGGEHVHGRSRDDKSCVIKPLAG